MLLGHTKEFSMMQGCCCRAGGKVWAFGKLSTQAPICDLFFHHAAKLMTPSQNDSALDELRVECC